MGGTLTAMVLASVAAAQPEPPRRGHVLLPPVYGATVLSTQIHAQAAYIASVGDFLESAAIARRHHAIAAEHEMRNALKWVETYFERRSLNRAYRLKEDPPYLDKEQYRHEKSERRIVEQPYLAVKGNLTDELNWLLVELSSTWLASQLLPGNQALADSDLNQKLAPEEIRHIRMTDGGRVAGQTLVFRADDADVLKTRWPRALAAPELEAARAAFEKVRDETARAARVQGQIAPEDQQRLMKAVDELCDAFNRHYPVERRTSSSADYLLYAAGKRFLQSLAGTVYRALDVNDARVFDGSYRFQGDTTVDLINHMFEHGLYFAPPEPGGEGPYQKLFYSLRHLYLRLGSSSGGTTRELGARP